jgi:hypothetical protein
MEPYPEQEPAGPSDIRLSKGLPVQVNMHQGQSITDQLPAQHILDKKAVSLLQDLKATVEQIPSNMPNVTLSIGSVYSLLIHIHALPSQGRMTG